MGLTKRNLSTRAVDRNTVFNNRFVTEICEDVHVHYRNLRIVMSLDDWVDFARGNKQALERWEKLDRPECNPKSHIELCRKKVAIDSKEDMVRINLNKCLYPKFEGKIYAEGAEIDEDEYVHVKIRDLRLEMTKDEFKVLAGAFKEAEGKLDEAEDSSNSSMLQKT